MTLMTQASSTLVHRVRLALFWGATVTASSCGGRGADRAPTEPPEGPQQPAQPTAPVAVPGTLVVRLVTPNADDGAILVEISSPAPLTDLATPVQGAVVHSRSDGNTTRAAVFGSLASGPLVKFSVPDVNAASRYSAKVTEASDRTNVLRPGVQGYQLTIAP